MSRQSNARPRFRPTLTRLEGRENPAQFGVPWADPTHLTLSLVPDGTTTEGVPSALFATLDAQMPRAVWQDSLARAVQAWVAPSNITIGVVADSGAAMGTPGATQADPRFGDIRIAAVPMEADALAVTVPPDPVVSGSFAGDVFLNSNAAFTAKTLYSVLVHELGHALGLAPSTDHQSAMFNTLNEKTKGPGRSDQTAAAGLYGRRTSDPHEGLTGNDTPATATRLDPSDDGKLPSVAFGDITVHTDVDVFEVRTPDLYTGPTTIRVRTTGISLLAAKATLTDQAGNVLVQAAGSGVLGDVLTLTLPTTAPDGTYFLRIEAAPATGFAVGRYAIGMTFDGLLQATALPLDTAMTGPFDGLSESQFRDLFRMPEAQIYEDDGHGNDTGGSAVTLSTAPGVPANTRYLTSASLSDATDVDVYQVQSPNAVNGAPWVLTATVRGVGENPAAPRLEVLDDHQQPIAFEVLVNADGSFAVQAAGLAGNQRFLLRVSSTRVGNYSLDAAFGRTVTGLATLDSATLATPTASADSTLYVARTQLFSFTLKATGTAGTLARLEIRNAGGTVVYQLDAPAGETVSAVSRLLPPGEYSVRVTTVVAPGTPFAPISFVVRGTGITDPIGPVVSSTTLTPQYTNPTDPNTFLYPNGTVTIDPFLWLLLPRG